MLDDVGLPRLLELGCFFDLVWADDLPVVCVDEDFAAVVCVVDALVVWLLALRVVVLEVDA